VRAATLHLVKHASAVCHVLPFTCHVLPDIETHVACLGSVLS